MYMKDAYAMLSSAISKDPNNILAIDMQKQLHRIHLEHVDESRCYLGPKTSKAIRKIVGIEEVEIPSIYDLDYSQALGTREINAL